MISSWQSKKVQREVSLWNKTVTYRGWKGWITGAQAGDYVVFVGADGAFRCVYHVDMQRDKLEVNVLVFKSSFELTGALIIEYVNVRGFPTMLDRIKDLLACGGDTCSLEILDEYQVD